MRVRRSPGCRSVSSPARRCEATALSANMQFYERHAADFVQDTVDLDLEALHNRFLSQLPSKSARILDAGCGSGRDSAAFRASGFRVTAIDASPAMVRAARHLGVRATRMELQELPYREEFDGIWACASLLHVPHSQIRSVLRRLRRALRPGGVIFVTLKEGRGERLAEDGRFFAYYGLHEFADLLREVGGWTMLDNRRTRDDRGRQWLNFLAQRKTTPRRGGASRGIARKTATAGLARRGGVRPPTSGHPTRDHP